MSKQSKKQSSVLSEELEIIKKDQPKMRIQHLGKTNTAYEIDDVKFYPNTITEVNQSTGLKAIELYRDCKPEFKEKYKDLVDANTYQSQELLEQSNTSLQSENAKLKAELELLKKSQQKEEEEEKETIATGEIK
tara:strand:+ start:1886 stop:2287 length:402 start_codon:yes stop_codon:yes gene_type:complete